MNITISTVLEKRPILKPFEAPYDIQNLKVGFIENERWGVVFKIRQNDVVKKCMFFFRDKHLYLTTTLNRVLSNVEKRKSNFVDDMKCLSDMIKWWIGARAILLKTMPKVLKR